MESEDFDEAFRLLNKGILDGIQPDVLLYNRIVQKASEKVTNSIQLLGSLLIRKFLPDLNCI